MTMPKGPTQRPDRPLVSYEQLRQATSCPDCDSELWFYPVPIPLPGRPVQLFGPWIAHDETCPAARAADAAAQQRGNQP